MKPEEARELILIHLQHYNRMPIYDVTIYRLKQDGQSYDDYSFRELLKIAYQLEEKKK